MGRANRLGEPLRLTRRLSRAKKYNLSRTFALIRAIRVIRGKKNSPTFRAYS